MDHVEAGGATIPKLGLGTWQNQGETCREAVETALELGYRHIDTAQVYGNEDAVGDAIAASAVDREDVFLTTKVWRGNLRPDDVHESVQESLDRLGVDYLDLLLIHWPHPRFSAEKTLHAMAELREDGLVDHLGVSNFTRSQLEAAVDAVDAPLVANQVLYHPFKDQSNLLKFCQREGVALTAYSPLARGAAISDAVLERIGERHGKSAAQVALRWLVQQDNVVAIPKATGRNHIAANLEIFDFELSDHEMEEVATRRPGLKTRLYNASPALVRRMPF